VVPIRGSAIRITKTSGDVVEGTLVDHIARGYLLKMPDGSAVMVVAEDVTKVESAGAAVEPPDAAPQAAATVAPSEKSIANAVWVRGVPGGPLTAGVGLLAYCVADPEPRCVPAKFPVEDGFIKEVLSVHRTHSPEEVDIVWLGLGDSESTFWWGAAATEFTVVRCSASVTEPTPVCQVADL
jgi:hypothetical protein